jgi:GT2 family glycosyltransferase
MTRPDLSIIIVSWNARSYLVDCLKSIEETAGGIAYEVIVVDNASSDGSPEAVRNGAFRNVRLFEPGANLGFAKGNNLGIKQSCGRYYCLMNSDVTLKPHCLERLVAFMDSHQDVGLAAPRLLNRDGSYQASCRFQPRLRNHFGRAIFINRSLVHPACEGSKTAQVEVLSGAFWIARREAVERVGLLDEDFFFYGEDIDWCQRFRAAGWKVCFHPESEAIHYGGASSSTDPFRFNIQLQHACLQHWEKYNGRCSTLTYLLINILYHGLRLGACTIGGLVRTHDASVLKGKRAQHVQSLRWVGKAIADRLLGKRPSMAARQEQS